MTNLKSKIEIRARNVDDLGVTVQHLFLFLILFLSPLFINSNNAEAGMLNRFKKGFYFEKYKTAEEAKENLLKLHPIGSDVKELVKTLERSGGKCSDVDSKKLEKAKINNPKIKHLTNVIHCEVLVGFINPIAWRVGVMAVENKIDDIGIGKEYMGL
jgi:hypothetical protein